jgi:hypothetical protein
MRSGEIIAGVAAGLCVLPSAVVNVAPHIAQGAHDSGAAATAVFQGVSVLTMASMPFAVKNLSAATQKAGCYLLAAVLLTLNFFNALDVASSVRESATGVSRGTINAAAGLNSRLAEKHKSRSQVPPHTFTSAASASAAQSAADEAKKVMERECEWTGRKCDQKTADAVAAQTKLAAVLEQRALTERAEKLDGEIADLERDLTKLGPVPAHADSTAAKVTRVLNLFIKVSDDDVSEWRPIAFAFGIELLAFLGPVAMFAAFAGARAKDVDHVVQARAVRVPGQGTPRPQIPVAAVAQIAGVAPAPASPAKPARSKVKAKKAPIPAGDVGNIREWYEVRTIGRPGHEIRCNEAFDAYSAWCKERGSAPVSLTRFGTFMKGDLGVKYRERSKRGYYLDVALKGVVLKVVAG